MKNVALLAAVLLIVACTSLRPVAAPQQEIQRRILSGELLQPGDQVRVVTTDGVVQEFRVGEIKRDEGVLTGEGRTMQVADIVTIEKRERSWLKTGFLAAGVAVGVGLLTADCEDDCDEYGGFLCCS